MNGLVQLLEMLLCRVYFVEAVWSVVSNRDSVFIDAGAVISNFDGVLFIRSGPC